MSKIDVSSIAGYAEMTAEQKVEALEQYEVVTAVEPQDGNVAKLKNALSNANSEAAEWKRKYRDTLTEQERKDAERQEQQSAIESELNALRRDKTVNGYIAEYLAIGYPADLAKQTAEAMADGDTTAVFASQKVFLAEQMKAMEAKSLNQQPTLSVGKPVSSDDMKEAEYQKLRRYAGLK